MLSQVSQKLKNHLTPAVDSSAAPSAPAAAPSIQEAAPLKDAGVQSQATSYTAAKRTNGDSPTAAILSGGGPKPTIARAERKSPATPGTAEAAVNTLIPAAAGTTGAEPTAPTNPYSNLSGKEKAELLLKDLNSGANRGAALEELKKMSPRDLGRSLEKADPATRVGLFNELVSANEGKLGTQLQEALRGMQASGRADLFHDVFSAKDSLSSSDSRDTLVDFMKQQPEASAKALGNMDTEKAGELLKSIYGTKGNEEARKAMNALLPKYPEAAVNMVAAAAHKQSPQALAELVKDLGTGVLGTALSRMTDEQRIPFFHQMANAKDPTASSKLFDALDGMSPQDRARSLAKVVEQGASQDFLNGRSLVAEYLDRQGKGDIARQLVATGPKELFRDLIANETSPRTRQEALEKTRDPMPRMAEDMGNMMAGRLNSAGSLSEITSALRTLETMTPKEVDMMMKAIAERADTTSATGPMGMPIPAGMKAALDQASDEEVQAFAHEIAKRGGPDSKAIALKWLAREEDGSTRDSREEKLRGSMVEIINSNGGDIINSPGGGEAVREAIYYMLDGDAPPTLKFLNEMTNGLAPDRAAAIDTAVKNGFQQYIKKKTEGSIWLDIAKGIDFGGSVSASTGGSSGSSAKGKVEGDGVEAGASRDSERKFGATGNISIKGNVGQIWENQKFREASRYLEDFSQHLEAYRGTFDNSPRSLHIYEQTLNRWARADAATGRIGRPTLPPRSDAKP